MKNTFSYQHKSIAEVLHAFDVSSSIVLVAPTGAGKTVMAAEIALHFKTVLWVAHRIELIDQAKAENGKGK